MMTFNTTLSWSDIDFSLTLSFLGNASTAFINGQQFYFLVTLPTL